MTAFLRALHAGDPASALAFWRSKNWTPPERKAALRLLAAARTVAKELLP
ncbi:MAG: hypothetical protein AAGC63_09725 [Propionicimonas sp.]